MPTTIQFDERFDVGVVGLAPGQVVTISATIGDYTVPFVAEATINADEWGVADLAMRRPLEGTWDVPDTMGLIWSAQGPLNYQPPINDPEHVTIVATINDVVVGEEIITRTILPPERVPTQFNDTDMFAEYYGPGGDNTAPAVIVVGGSDGGISPYTRVIAAMLAADGFATLVLAYFGIGRLPPYLSRIPMEYFGNAIAWLQDQPGVDPERIGVVGVSRGGELALLLGSRYPALKAVVSYVGSGYVYPEWAGLASDPDVPAWTWDGEPVPFIPSVDLTETALLEAEIPVERINGPVLLIGADSDHIWPSSFLSSIAWNRLQREGHGWPDQFLRYPGAGHAISTPPYMPVQHLASQAFGGDPHSNATAMANAWAAARQMLKTTLMY